LLSTESPAAERFAHLEKVLGKTLSPTRFERIEGLENLKQALQEQVHLQERTEKRKKRPSLPQSPVIHAEQHHIEKTRVKTAFCEENLLVQNLWVSDTTLEGRNQVKLLDWEPSQYLLWAFFTFLTKH
jgi:hypothetical protein